MSAFWAWLSLNWQTIFIDALAVDTFLIGIFPNATVLQTIKNWLSSLSKA